MTPKKLLTASWHQKDRSYWQRQLGQYIASVGRNRRLSISMRRMALGNTTYTVKNEAISDGEVAENVLLRTGQRVDLHYLRAFADNKLHLGFFAEVFSDTLLHVRERNTVT
jgi:hypothetical protein